MTKKKTTIGSEIVRRLNRFSKALDTSDKLEHRFTCRTVKLNLQPQNYTPSKVKQTRKLLGASQAIFAQFLGVSRGAVRDWEQGIKPPGGAACRTMDEICHNPQYFLERLRELSTPAHAQ